MSALGTGTRTACLSAFMASALACGGMRGYNPSELAMDGKVVTQEMIAAYNVANAWEVLKKTGAFRMSRDDGNGRPVEIRTRRGRNSISIRESGIPKVLLNGMQVWDMRYLKDIPAESIDWIQLLSGIEGGIQQGTNAGAGVILIVSRGG